MQMRCDEGDDADLFFDSAECLSIEESDVSVIGLNFSRDYAAWLSEPQGVEQRRKVFLLGMGLCELDSPGACSTDNGFEIHGDLSQIPDTERLMESSEAVLNTDFSVIDRVEDSLVRSRDEMENGGNSMINDEDREGKLLLDPNMRSDFLVDFAMKQEKRSNDFSWWKLLLNKINNKRLVAIPQAPSRENHRITGLSRVKGCHNKKRLVELSALYSGQDIEAHNGIIWTMKFSPDGKYLATGGEDGTVCIWRVTSVDASLEGLCSGPEICCTSQEESLFCKGKSINQASVLKPDTIFWIDETPVQVLRGHTSDVLDLAWSFSNKLLSSSKDNTVRLWQVGCELCQDVFHHSNYVTCVQFNPVDDDYFISGSIDGKARVWRMSTRRVVDWADVRDVISAICYRPHGKGFAVGTIAGSCHFYEKMGSFLQQDASISIQSGRKKTWSNKITSIQFSKDISGRVLISSQDSKLRIFEGNDVIYKYRGPRKSGSQMSASFTSNGKYMVSLGEDSRVYLWNQSDYAVQPNGSTKSVLSCEYFSSEGASVVIPWSGSCTAELNFIRRRNYGTKEQERFLLGKWFSQDQCRCSATWPEELLPFWEEMSQEKSGFDSRPPAYGGLYSVQRFTLSEVWGLVFVTGSQDGKIRTFHNYGLPVRL